jgi:hypothetical protein
MKERQQTESPPRTSFAAIRKWQTALREQPAVWAVFVTLDGISEQTGNIYATREGAEIEAAWLRNRGYKYTGDRTAQARKLGHLHSDELSRERWSP